MANSIQSFFLPSPENFNLNFAIVSSAKEATERSRKILIFICFAVVLAFSHFWSSRPGSWMNAEIVNFKKSILWGVDSNYVKRIVVLEEKRDEFRKIYMAHKRLNLGLSYKLNELRSLNEMRREELILVKIPVIGVKFHLNDLGFLGGSAFSILMLLLTLCTGREYDNLCIVKRSLLEHSSSTRNSFMIYMNTFQVMTVPSNSFLPHWYSYLSRIILISPLLMQSIIILNDFNTLSIGLGASKQNTIINTIASFFFLAIIARFTIQSYRLNQKIDNFWDNAQFELALTGVGNNATQQSSIPPSTSKNN